MQFDLDTRILALALARMVSALANSFLVVVLPLYIGQVVALPGFVGTTVGAGGIEFTVEPELLIGVVLSLFGFLNSFGQPFTGQWSDRTGERKRFLLLGLGIVAVGSAGYILFRSYAAVLAMRALQGVGAAFTIPMTVALVNEYSASGERGRNFGLFNTFRLLGFGTGPLVAGGVVAAGPYRVAGVTVSGFDAAFLVAVIGATLSFALIVLLISDPEEAEAAVGEDISIQVRNPDGPGLDPVFALGLGTVVMALGIAIYAPLANVINSQLDQGNFLFSVQFGATVLANVLFQLPFGRLSDSYGRRPFLVGGFVLLLPTTLAQGFVSLVPASLFGPAIGPPELMILLRFLQGRCSDKDQSGGGGYLPNRPRPGGLKGRAFSANPDDVSTTGSEATEERSESREPKTRGLSISLKRLSEHYPSRG